MFNTVLFMCAYIPTNILILVDRILEIKMSITYPVIWSVEKAKILLNLLRLLSAVIIISTLFAYHFAGFSFEFYVHFIIKPLVVSYFIISICTVVYISYELNKSRIQSYPLEGSTTRPKFRVIFRKARLRVPILLAVTHFVFYIVPLILYDILNDRRKTEPVGNFIHIKLCRMLSRLTTLVACICLKENLRKKFVQMLKCGRNQVQPDNGNQDDQSEVTRRRRPYALGRRNVISISPQAHS